ncbi:hypothetical protein GTY81_20845 [Streptomyces sp. SID8366]|uniref:hypothetical protein n=1 Tax=unclassified Streptomyces TaxID=2593676 RepID=UPI000DB989E2|nr:MULTISPECIES: hypothetical protein [unclassified Streptomyces]MYU06282.1 hypothetical protein [Streptomyces sp. SID8366]MYU66866.1 hypothetical protein [Streptomyces sp. SID69]RAJ53669.1 hypothetical protein K376_05631 [Streptomyces sp. PsTaAH-130]
MHGHGHGQPAKRPPHLAVLVLLRVLFVAAGFLSIGFLAWAMLLRLAAVTRRPLDWGLFVTALFIDVTSIVLVGNDPSEDASGTGGTLGMFLVLVTLVSVTTYYLIAEIRHYGRRAREFEARSTSAPAYGYPGPAVPSYAAPVLSAMPAALAMPGPHTPPPTAPHTPVPGPPPIAPPPHRPAPARIDQVRAELDELSDYLRKHDGQRDGRPEGGSGR